MESTNKPKFQLSWQSKTLTGAIAVVTGETLSEFKDNMTAMINYLSNWSNLQTSNNQAVATVMPSEQTKEDFCSIHNTSMKLRHGATGDFYSHAQPNGEGGWQYCSGKGWK